VEIVEACRTYGFRRMTKKLSYTTAFSSELAVLSTFIVGVTSTFCCQHLQHLLSTFIVGGYCWSLRQTVRYWKIGSKYSLSVSISHREKMLKTTVRSARD